VGELLKAVLKMGTGSLAGMTLGMAAMKVLAVVVGPGGVGLFSLLRQTYQTAVTVSVLNGQMAIVQGVASRDDGSRPAFLSTVLWIISGMGIGVSLVLLVFAPQLSGWVLDRNDPQAIQAVRWLAPTVLLGAGQAYLVGLMNGYRAVGSVALVQLSGFATLAVLALPAARLAKSGQILAFSWLLAASAAVAFLVATVFSFKHGHLAALWRTARLRFTSASAKVFVPMAGTFLITGFVGTAVPLCVRALASREFGLHGAGILDVAWTLSMAYIGLLLSSFSTYYLPVLSGMVDPGARARMILQVLRLALLLMLPLVTAMIVLKPLVARLLYSSEFLPALPIIRWMLIGDFFKVASWVFSFTMIASMDLRTFLWTEVACGAATLAGALVVLLRFQWLPGIGVNYMLLYIGYLIYTLFYVCRRHQFALDGRTILQWISGLMFVIVISIQTWDQTQVHPMGAVLWIGSAVGLSLVFLNRKERDAGKALLRRSRSSQAGTGPASQEG
jgi:O-antigen/teichoic acid export membrane protein